MRPALLRCRSLGSLCTLCTRSRNQLCTLPDSQSALHISIMATDTHTVRVHHIPEWFLDTLLIIKFSLFRLYRFSLFVSEEKRCMKSALGRCPVSRSGLLVVLRAGNLIQETQGENTPKNPVQKSHGVFLYKLMMIV